MKINIEFFKNDFIDAIGAGVYEIKAIYNNKDIKSVYIGESVFVLVRCATHWYELKKFPQYFGFTEETIDDENITLKFKLLKFPTDKNKEKKADRKSFEVEQIKLKRPSSQNGRADYQKEVEDRINSLNEFINDARNGNSM